MYVRGTVQHGIEVLDEYPIAGLALVVAVAALAYVLISAVFDGGVDPLNTVIFAVVFTVVYAGASLYLERREQTEQAEAE